MDKILEIQIGGRDVLSGLVPLSAFQMVKDLLEAIAAEGTDADIWKTIEPQLEVVGKASTRVAIYTPFARKLRPQVRTFREKARRFVLNPEGRDFVKKHVANPGTAWAYVDLVGIPDEESEEWTQPEEARILRFDANYKERYVEGQPSQLHGYDEIYAVVIRAGGRKPPRATLVFLPGGGGTYTVKTRELAKQIGSHLYETVKLRVEGWWNARTLEIENLVIHGLLDWKDSSLAEVYRANQNRLPITLTVGSVEELLAEREQDRGE